MTTTATLTATLRTSNRGNLAIQGETWVLPVALAKAVAAELGCTRKIGSYWHATIMRPLHRARARKQATITVYTAGFSTGELANVIRCIEGAEIQVLPDC